MNYDKFMTLDDLKLRLGIKDNENDDVLAVYLEDTIHQVLVYTNNKFLQGFPPDVKRAVSQMIKIQKQMDDMLTSSGSWEGGGESTVQREVKNVKIDGLSKSYATSGESSSATVGAWEKMLELPNSPINALKPYRRLRYKQLGCGCR